MLYGHVPRLGMAEGPNLVAFDPRVLSAKPVMRTVDRIELPSTRQLMICALSALLGLFILTTMREELICPLGPIGKSQLGAGGRYPRVFGVGESVRAALDKAATELARFVATAAR